MGLFDFFKKKTEAEAPTETNDENTVGWDAIEKEFLRVYPGQTKPKHYGTIIKYVMGGNDPLDGISVYDGGSYWHFVSFGLSEIYDKECENKEISGYGYELTFKLKKKNTRMKKQSLRISAEFFRWLQDLFSETVKYSIPMNSFIQDRLPELMLFRRAILPALS